MAMWKSLCMIWVKVFMRCNVSIYLYLCQQAVRLWKQTVIISLLLGIYHFDAIACGKELELLHSDGLLASEVPSDQVFKLALGKLKTAPLDQSTELLNVHLLSALLLNSIEKPLEELVILRLICELVSIIRIECAHKLAKLGLVDAIWLAIHCIRSQIVHQTIVESLLGRCVILRINGSWE